MNKVIVIVKGGKGSGHHGHAGRPGKVGGSSPSKFGSVAKPGTGPAHLPDVPPDYYWGMPTDIYAEKMLNKDMPKDPYGELPNTSIAGNTDIFTWQDVTEGVRGRVKDQIVNDLSNRTGISYREVNTFVEQWANTANGGDMRSLSIQEAASEELGIPLSDWQKDALGRVKLRRQYAIDNRMDRIPNSIERYMDFSTSGQVERAQVSKDFIYELLDSPEVPNPDIEKIADEYYAWKKFGNEDPRKRKRFMPYTYDMANKNVNYRNNDISSLLPRKQERALIRAMYNSTQERFAKLGIDGIGGKITLYRGFSTSVEWKQGDTVPYNGNVLESWTLDKKVADGFGHITIAIDVPLTNIISTSRTGFGCLSEGEFIVAGSLPGNKVKVVSTHDYNP